MNFNYIDYCQYLLNSHTNYTITNLANHLENVSHDKINRYLKIQNFDNQDLWRNVKKEIIANTEGYLIFDDTVINKKHSNKIELVRRQYSGNEHQVVRGIGIVNCIYFNPKIEQFWLIDYRIYDPDTDKKTKIDHVEEMILCVVNQKKLPFKTVLMDSWYATQRLMGLIDNMEKIYYCPLKINRLVDDTRGIEKYKKIEELTWNEPEKISGKIIKIKGFPRDKKVKLFWATISTNRTEYIATNDLCQASVDAVEFESQTRWKIEEFHREIKQLTGIEFCQCRLRKIQKNHIACAILVWNFLKRLAVKIGKTIYQVKHELLSDYLIQELEKPTIKFRAILIL
ncbi:IS701 family transposase [Dapis sp. BLCC M126]|uniref:IS701 family transposase n=1 Tax=Dapis sp. BLCC M126 TaxID=3400189 RepID=UPI003CE8ECCE